MKRFHVHVSVGIIEQSVHFHSTLFGCKPVRQLDDYAKWMLDYPRVNFAVSSRDAKSDMHRITDPSGIAWESFHTLADIPTFTEQVSGKTLSAVPLQVLQVESDSCCGHGGSCSPRVVAS